ncbi:MAG: hypothetical protein K0U74_11115 [Alphaproteobacteria bacterium]|nr:hypothetical protein [Alphaproteobacteria bacterium]
MKFAASQQWTYRTPIGHEQSRIVIGAIATTADNSHIVCFSVLNAPGGDTENPGETVTIPFIPMHETAFAQTVIDLIDRPCDPPADFSPALQAWSEDQRGLSIFTVPFEGSLDRMIALQMAAIVSPPSTD